MQIPTWSFINDNGDFSLPNPQRTSALYFPLVNAAGMISVVTPLLGGDAKTGQNSFLLSPVSVEDLHISRASRNFWVMTAEGAVWSVMGNSAPQRAGLMGEEDVTLEAGFLWHRITRKAAALGLQAQMTSVVPPGADHVELLQIVLTNVSDHTVTFTPTAAIPLFGRSADNLRDHRHVTSLLHRIRTHSFGVLVKPTLSFDERGHTPNTLTYAVLGAEGDGVAPEAFFPTIEEFIGEGGALDWPAAVRESPLGAPVGTERDGYEALGGLRFREVTLAPGENRAYVLILAVLGEKETPEALLERYGTQRRFAEWLEQTRADWATRLNTFAVMTGDARFNGWMRWVALQPTLRRWCGNSFLPYHDYGRGGRGWRDLWQDLLAVLLTTTEDSRPALWHNFAGVRMDGSNATIIGTAPGEFKADRNNIPRVWMDHGAWPLLTTLLYINATGDLDFLLADQVFFQDAFTHRAQRVDSNWTPEAGNILKTAAGVTYQGSILEHLLVQHLTAFFNVGEHNTIRLEGADWNDGLDMAPARGESVAFTALYAGNLREIARLLRQLERVGVTQTALAVELLALLDTLGSSVDYDSVADKHARLNAYYASVQPTLSGEKTPVSLTALAHDLDVKADWLTAHLRAQEWLVTPEGYGWYNGYYDNDGQRVEGEHIGQGGDRSVRMTLTGQVFALLAGVATEAQATDIVRAVEHYLYDESVGGPRLNTDFGEVLHNLGRCFGFAYGHKENGAMFTHMAVMYANALYRRGFAREGYRVLDGIYRHCQNFPVSRMYPGLPEYITPDGRGVYTYLTGSASWYLFTLLTEAYGVQGQTGDLRLAPRLVREQFDELGKTGVHTLFAGRQLDIIYSNPSNLDVGNYMITSVMLDGAPLRVTPGPEVLIPRTHLDALDAAAPHRIEITLQ
ncbi:MAG: cellobiose phosphorylase [Anaerolineae bacterium]|nr:cellobiose phosphorylase [Anaerolineae bacterium]